MARKPTPPPETPRETEVTAEVLDALNHDGSALGPGDTVTLPLADAIKLRGQGVVGFADPTPAA